jgi:hypothetical protein
MATITMGRWLMATMMAAFEQRAARPQKKEGGEKEVLVGWNVAHHPRTDTQIRSIQPHPARRTSTSRDSTDNYNSTTVCGNSFKN